MTKTFTYLTVTEPVEAIFTDKGSKFIAYLIKTESLEIFRNELEKIKSAHTGARHFCYASRIGKENPESRSNDDGEPSGTAGKPILNQILSKNLTDISVVVVRYFGGTLLGTSGLINAYKQATADAIAIATIEEKQILTEVAVHVSYEAYNHVMHLIKKNEGKITQSESLENEMVLSVILPQKNRDTFLVAINNPWPQ